MKQPNVLFVMTDNQRADTIAALGNEHIYTPNLDRLVRRGLSFDRAYTPCPICTPARYVIRTGCLPPTTRCFTNALPRPRSDQPQKMEDRCGEFLARRMGRLGYRTFGIGKFHPMPHDEDLGFEYYRPTGELYADPERRQWDAYASWIRREHPAYDFLEGPLGERAEMFYMPQMRPVPKEATMEWWTADEAVAQIQRRDDGRPFFGFVSFIAPHPPFCPPIPFNRMYDPDRMPAPIGGDIATDHLDPSIVLMTHALWAEDVSPQRAKVLKARYYGMVSFMDHCLGRILDAVEARGEADNTLIAFFTDHGEHLGDHHAYHMDGYFDTSCRIPYLLSWPGRLPANQRRRELVGLVDLFGMATAAAGRMELRQGADVLGMVAGRTPARENLCGFLGLDGTRTFRMTIRDDRYKYIFLANGGIQFVFDMADDPHERRNLAAERPELTRTLRAKAVAATVAAGGGAAVEAVDFKVFDYQPPALRRICQFDRSRGIEGFPANPGDVLK